MFTGYCEPTYSCQSSEEGIEYEGKEIDEKWNVDSVESCANECKSMDECKVWTFIGSSSACFLKSSRIKDIPSSEAISGECTISEGGKPFSAFFRVVLTYNFAHSIVRCGYNRKEYARREDTRGRTRKEYDDNNTTRRIRSARGNSK